ncbi:Uncharacterised protein [Mycobacterium tuberculosis]|uniref:Uncharacterized protein n=1 Tax=Mycobacterium tuberculosis TaxID=1773 RepID=A0A655ITE9_MYCTX|nr:Uncharacterised protein [Mycobacterium tuberculosis]
MRSAEKLHRHHRDTVLHADATPGSVVGQGNWVIPFDGTPTPQPQYRPRPRRLTPPLYEHQGDADHDSHDRT